MSFLVIPLTIAVFFAVLFLLEARCDSRGHRTPPSSHARDPRFAPPGRGTR